MQNRRLLQQGNIRHLQEQVTQFRQQRQTVDTDFFIFRIHHHVFEELIYRFAQEASSISAS